MSDLRKAAADALRALEVATTPLARDRQEVLRARDALRAALAAAGVCGECGGTGELDSGGIYPWGEPAMIRCPCTERPAALAQEAEPDVWAALEQARDFIGHTPHGDNCFVSSHYPGDPGDRCNCGKDGIEAYLDDVLVERTAPPAAPAVSDVDSIALEAAHEIALIWGQNRSQFVAKIQVRVIAAIESALAAKGE